MRSADDDDDDGGSEGADVAVGAAGSGVAVDSGVAVGSSDVQADMAQTAAIEVVASSARNQIVRRKRRVGWGIDLSVRNYESVRFAGCWKHTEISAYNTTPVWDMMPTRFAVLTTMPDI